jgi:hypothetical protein
MKQCTNCNQIKPLDLFYKRKTQKDGHRSECKECEQAYNKSDKVRAKTKARNEKTKEYRNNWYKENSEIVKARSKKFREENKEFVNEIGRIYKKTNPGKINAINAKRNATKLRATPKWLTQFDLDYIKNLYIQAKELEKLDGIKRHIDHIIPLQGKTVSGLHLPWNLQILTAEENMRKHNCLKNKD